MPRISKEKRDKVQEQILYFLYSIFPKQVFTVDVAREIARDEEFIKNMMLELEKNDLVVKIDKNSEGAKYGRRLRWRISNKAYEIYNASQQNLVKSAEIKERVEQNLEETSA